MDYEKIGNFLYELRKKRNLTQQELSKRFFVSREAISKWERGISLPDYPSLIALSKFYNITINEILAGEKINENNRERIEAVALTILESSEKKIRKSKIINISIFLISLMLILIFYFVNNYNSIHLYQLHSSNNEYYIKDGELFIQRDQVYLKFGNIYKSDGKVLTNKDNVTIKLYYYNEEKRILFDSDNVENIIIDFDNHKEIVNEIGIDELTDNLYLDIKDSENVITLKIDKVLFYSNDFKSIFSRKEDKYIFDILKYNDENNPPKTYEICGKKYRYNVSDDSIEFFSKDGKNVIIYSKNFNQITINIDSKYIAYSYNLNRCLSSDCEEYLDIIKSVEKDLEKLNGLN